MYTISNNSKYELIIKNSKFITLMYKIDNELMIKDILSNVRIEYPDANHYCYAYILNNIKKSSDDGEPSGTAGIPILKVLESNNLTNILVIVIRYFGGIKLGANGLIRAYSKGVANAIKENTLSELIDGYNILISFSYQDVKKIDYLLKDIKINNKSFDKIITYDIDIDNNFLQVIINNQIEYQIIKDIKIEK
ncbi:MAG: YigZ family protein [Bacilli bacterium]|nr:YigZ family protein [Bacilli bacterium]